MRETPGFTPSIGVRASYDKRAFKVHRTEVAVLLDTQFDWLGDAIEAQVVLVYVDFSQQFAFELFELHLADGAFENRFLHALADALAGFGDATQAFAPGRGFSRDVVGNDDEHQLFGHVGQIAFHFSTQGTCDEASLDEG